MPSLRFAAARIVLAASLVAALPSAFAQELPFDPRGYVAYRAGAPLQIDGRADEPAWRQAPWTDDFVDIEGPVRPMPRFRTRAKMLWDDDHLYIAAWMEEPHLWATLTERDAVIFYDNDFEVFIDPDGDTHQYYELEVNALGTAWDLFLVKPYRDGGPPIDAWDIQGLQLGIDLQGTLNDPSDRDTAWTVEIAIPWSVLRQAASPRRAPESGDQWRLNFSRVQWHLDVEDGRYTKRLDPDTGDHLPENNWVWSPQGVIDMHRPERWGVVQFSDAASGTRADTVRIDPNERLKFALRSLYYAQRRYRSEHGRYAASLTELGAEPIVVDGRTITPRLHATPTQYELIADGFDGATVHLHDDGRTWIAPQPDPSP